MNETIKKWGAGLFFLVLPVLMLMACAQADTLYIPASVDTVMEEAYAGDAGFDRLILPPGIREIGRNAFRGCGFDAVYLPPSLMVLGENAFDSDVTIYVCPDSPVERELYRQGRAYTPLLLPDSVTILNDGAEILPGGQAAMQVTVEPVRSDTAHLIWSSSDESVATVSDQGVVTGVGEGTAVIRVETLAGVSGSAEVTVAGRKSVCRALRIANVNYMYMYTSECCRWNAGDIELLRSMLGTVYAPNGEPWRTTVAYDQYYQKLETTIRNTFAGTQEGDISLIHISSHGYNKFDEGNYHAVGVKMSSGSSMTYISFSKLKELTDRYIRGDVILILETCYAGGAIETKCGAPFRAKGYYVLASCLYEEHCYSHNGDYNYFVEWLCDGVNGLKADTNRDGALSLGELQTYIYNKGRTINVGSDGENYYQHSQAYPVNSDYILFIAR